jgi:HK97 family phage major capsid protein
MTITVRELRARRADAVDKANALSNVAELADRDLTADEQVEFDGLLAEADKLEARAARLENLDGLEGMLEARQAPTVAKIGRGDNEVRALAHFVKTGDTGGVSHLVEEDNRGKREVVLKVPTAHEMRAVVDSTMNITTAADGKNIVPIGFVQDVAIRKAEKMLAPLLGVRRVPGKGTTVNYPYEAADPEAFAVTNEQSDAHDVAYTRDAGNTGLKAFTLLKYTRKIDLTEELLEDEDVGLMDYIAGRIARQVAGTHNTLLLAEVASNGTALVTYASATAIAAGEPEKFVFHDTLSYFMEENEDAAWVMRPTTHRAIASITGSDRMYAENPAGSFNKNLLGYPVFYSNKATASAASAKDAYFGVWDMVGYREAPEMRFIMDPYSVDGLTVLKYSFRTVYGVLQAGAVGYGVHPSA